MSFERNLSIDLIKTVAAFGVVIIHLTPSTHAAEAFTQLFSLFAVPFFFLISLHFFESRVAALSSPRLSDLRLDRLLVPYAVWTAIYTLLRLLKYRIRGDSLHIDVAGVTLFGGGAVQLYFIPLLVLFQAQAFALILMVRGSECRLVGFGVALVAVVFGYVGSAGGFFGFNSALIKGLIYVALAFLLHRTQTAAIGRQINSVFGWLIVALIVPSAFFGYPLAGLGILEGPIIGYGVAVLALNWRFHTAIPTLRTVLTCSYGIYLAHVVFLEGFEFFADKLGYRLTPFSLGAKALVGSLVCLSCVLCIEMARKHRISAYLLLGEADNRVASGYPATNSH
jgi:fucose 4-O-acetylase-like acetyltransferase